MLLFCLVIDPENEALLWPAGVLQKQYGGNKSLRDHGHRTAPKPHSQHTAAQHSDRALITRVTHKTASIKNTNHKLLYVVLTLKSIKKGALLDFLMIIILEFHIKQHNG